MTTQQIIEKIKEKTKLNDNGCEYWTGSLDQKGNPILHFCSKVYSIRKWLWNAHNKDNQIAKKSEYYCHYICGNKLCVSLIHLEKRPKAKEVDFKSLWERLLKRGERQQNGCLYWIGIFNRGYGSTSFKSKPIYVHRLSWLIKQNMTEFPVGLVVRHLCNNSKCFEPSHLQLGTHYDNEDDKIAAQTILRGQKNHKCTITEDLARQIKLSKPAKNPNYRSIEARAKLYNVKKSLVEKIDKNENCNSISKELFNQIKASKHPKYLNNGKSQKERAEMFNVSLHIVQSIDNNSSWEYIPDNLNNTTSNTKLKVRAKRAKERIWTDEMWNHCKQKILDNSELSNDINQATNTFCRIWKGALKKSGYGNISAYGRTFLAHVLSCSVKNKMHRPKNLVTKHLCENKICVAEDHLEFVTLSQSRSDSAKNTNAKITVQNVLDIRKKYSEGFSQVQLAKDYNMSVGNMAKIVNNKMWKHVKINNSE